MDLPSIGKRLLSSITPKVNKSDPAGGTSPVEITKWFAEGQKHADKKVTWELIVHAMYSDFNSQDILVRTTCEDYPQDIWVPLNLSAYPEILNSPAGTRLQVHGKVHIVKEEDIYLKDCQIEFLT